jgi:hypothetical protein
MKLTKILLLALIPLTAQAQNNYTQAIRQGDAALRRGEYKTAIKKYFAGEAFDPSKKDLVQRKVETVFDKIEALRVEAEQANKTAQDALAQVKAEQEKTQQALNATKLAQGQTDAALQKAVASEAEAQNARADAENARLEAESALKKATKLINAFAFYKDRFALAYGPKMSGNITENVFYFIDKDGNEVSKLGRWDDASTFQQMGYAEVGKSSPEGQIAEKYYVDTFGHTFLISRRLRTMNQGVEALDLSDRGYMLEFRSKKIAKNKSLKILDLSRNMFDFLGPKIWSLKELRVLDVQINAIRRLSPKIAALQDLTYLDLSFNELKKLPPEIGQLKNLRQLYLASNQMNELPAEICQLTNLEILDLSNAWTMGNQLRSLPQDIGQLKNLNYLNLYGNPISVAEIERIQLLLPACTIKYNFQAYAAECFKNKQFAAAFAAQVKESELYSQDYNVFFNLSWYALFSGRPQEAIVAARKTMEFKPNAQTVETNLALGYLLDNQWAEAEKIYLRWKKQEFPPDGKRLWDSVFLQDIADLEAAGITHPDFEKVRNMFAK